MKKEAREGYKMTELGEIPNGWEVVKLKEIICEFVVPMRDKPKIFDGNIPWCRIEDIEGNYLHGNREGRLVSEKIIEEMNLKVLPKNSLIASCSATLGVYAINTIPLITNQTFIGLIPGEKVSVKYLLYYMNMASLRLKKNASGTTIPYISRESFEQFNIALPTIGEQEKIAEILSTVDEQIENTEKLIQKNQELKKGLMQQLLTKGIGHTEFKKTKLGNIPKEWKIKKIYDLVQYMKSGLSRNLKDDDIGIPCIRSNNIIDNKIDDKDLKYWYLEDDKGANINEYILDDGDILVNFINSVAQIGKTCIYKDIGRPVIYTTNIFRIKMNQDVILNKYFYYFTQIEKYKKEIMLITKPAVNQASFTTQDFKRIELMVPPIEEQDKIVLILSSIDEKIEEYKNKKESLKEVKKGLMEQLLTGKLRIA
ncbi:restriction endonuclease subunit S [Clostridium perfringens]|uniref:restriction endonuclease subunit S n=1 Tax=Clostridium perfringens TaxID=1502 RepID=UPI001459F418|nr:hypothetical protein [Clostridium perfringens]